MSADVEALLREALAPVDPPATLGLSRRSSRAGPNSPRMSWRAGSWRRCATRATGSGRLRRSRSPRPPARRSCWCAFAPDTAPGSISRAICASSPSGRFTTSRRKPGGSFRIASVRARVAVCYRHPSRETGVSCSSCGRPICPDCMTPTSVGMRCPECAGIARRVRQHAAPPAGGDASAGRNPIREWSVTQFLIVINVIVFLAEVATGVALFGGTLRRLGVHQRRPVRPGDDPRLSRVLAAADIRLPARQRDPHRPEHAVAVVRRARRWSRRSES